MRLDPPTLLLLLLLLPVHLLLRHPLRLLHMLCPVCLLRLCPLRVLHPLRVRPRRWRRSRILLTGIGRLPGLSSGCTRTGS